MTVHLGFRGQGHASRVPGGGGSAPPGSAITSLGIMGASPLLDATGDYADATSRIGINGDGWVAKVTVPYLAGQTFDPSKISLNVTDPGYDAEGTTTVSRTIIGTRVLRRQYSANASNQQSNDGVTLTVYFALSDWIYQGSTIASATAATGFYGLSASGGISTRTNGSGRGYSKPLFAWLNLQHERATGDFAVEAVAFHRHAMNGRQVARIEFAATDASAHAAPTQTASSTGLSSIQTKGNIAEAYKATIPVSALSQGDICQVNAKVFPWIGDSSAVLDLSTGGIAWPTSQPQTKLRFLNDKTGAYGGAVACVKNSASGGTVQTSISAARSTPFPTIAAAIAALVAWNGSNKGHADHSGSTIYLMEDSAGGGATIGINNDLAGASGQCWTDIKVDPAATGSVSLSLTAWRDTVDKLRWMADLSHTAAQGLDGGVSNGYIMAAYEGMRLSSTSSAAPVNWRCGLTYLRNVTLDGFTDTASWPFAPTSTYRTQVALGLGCVTTNNTADLKTKPTVLIGCQFHRAYLNENDFSQVPNCDSHDGMVIYNCSFMNSRIVQAVGLSAAFSRGIAFVQNLVERAVAASSVPALQIAADGATVTVDNLVLQHVTIPGVDGGGRLNAIYADVSGAAGVLKTGASMRFNLWAQYNCKTDTFAQPAQGTGRVGNWANRYTVGHEGNVALQGDANGNTTPAADGAANFLGEYWQAGCSPGVGVGAVTFANDKSGTAGTGNGAYGLTGGTSAAYGRVPAGRSVLAYDLAGASRRTDGAGACGAYERTVG